MEEYKKFTFELHKFNLCVDTISIFITIDHPNLLKKDISLSASFVQIKNDDYTINVVNLCNIFANENRLDFNHLSKLLYSLRKKAKISHEIQQQDIVYEFLNKKICPILNEILSLCYKKI